MPTRIELFTPEEIEKYGFVYEPDATKCKTGKTKVTYCDSGKNEDGTIHHSPNVFQYSGLSEKYLKEEIAFGIWLTHVHSIFVLLPDFFPFSHVHNKVMFQGHTRKEKDPTDEEIQKFIDRPVV